MAFRPLNRNLEMPTNQTRLASRQMEAGWEACGVHASTTRSVGRISETRNGTGDAHTLDGTNSEGNTGAWPSCNNSN